MPVSEASPFAEPQKGSQPQPAPRSAASPARVVFVVCALIGLVAVGWRASANKTRARAHAAAEAAARGGTIDLQFGQAVMAVDSLATLARQSGGVLSNFQQAASRLLASPAGLASVELQPGGVVGDVAPRAGNERALGVNVLTDPAQRLGASAAVQTRSITISAPLALAHGEPGLVARAPVFLKGRDGRDFFWGFLAVSVRLADVLARAHVAELPKLGYDYAVVSPPSPSQKGMMLAAAGEVSMDDAVKQRVGVQSAPFVLALRPSHGWVNATRVALESLGVIGLAGLLALLAHLLDSRHALDEALLDAKRRLASEAAARKQALEESIGEKESAKATRAELKLTRADLEEARSMLAESQARLETVAHNAREIDQSKQADILQAETVAQQARQTIDQLETRLQATARAQQEAEAAARTRGELDAATIADLKSRLSLATRQAREAAEAGAAGLKELEASHRELKQRLAAAEDAAARAAEPTLSALSQNEHGDQTPPPPAPAPQAVATAVPSTAQALEPTPTVPAPPPEPVPTPLEMPPPEKPARQSRPRKTRGHNQMDLFGGSPPAPPDTESLPTEHEPSAAPPRTDHAASISESSAEAPDQLTVGPAKPRPTHHLPAPPPLDHAQFRKAASLMVPLLTDGDPGAADCLRSNRDAFRSVFTPEAYLDFEQLLKAGDHGAALEQLRRAGKRHGVPV